MDGNVAFSDAVARARQIAAKLGSGAGPAPSNPNPLTGGLSEKGNPNNMPLGVKRSFGAAGSSDEDEWSSKKFAGGEPDPITAQLRAIADQQRSAKDIAKMAAEQVAAKINQQIGGGGSMPQMSMPSSNPGPHAGLGMVITEDWSVPNRMVGLVIGSKGETITQIQAQSGCRIQIAPDPAPGTHIENRHVSLNGTHEAIQKAKELIGRTINEAQHAGTADTVPPGSVHNGQGQTSCEMMIQANKVGLVIGKGGETIKNLQMKSGCKMVMVQDGPYANAPEKPLRITGDPMSVEGGRRMVQELLDSKDQGDYGGDYARPESMPVPREAVGIIIGKGGEMIKQIQARFNVRVQFQQDSGGPTRMCDVSGSANDVYQAKQHIQELIQEGGSRGRGGAGGPPRGGAAGGGRGGFQGAGSGQQRGGYEAGYGEDTTTMRVPSEKCGIVIGKGGETIRQINQMSGAHVELNRAAPQNLPEKEFTIRGTPEAIQHAMQLIAEKAQLPPPGQNRPGPPNAGGAGGAGGWGGPPQNGSAHFGGGAGGANGAAGWGGPPAPHGGSSLYGGPGHQQNPAAAPWGNYNYNQWGQQPQQAPAGDQSQNSDPAWQAYYAQYYAQYNQQPVQGQGQPPAAAAAPVATSAAAAAAPTPTINPQTGQADYSEAWAAYYRQMGWHEQAEAILKQARGGSAPGDGSNAS